VGIWWSTILGLVLSAWAVRSPLHSADSNFGRTLTTDLPRVLTGLCAAKALIPALLLEEANSPMADDRYFLGCTPAELKRLRFQATILRPITERLLREAGVKEGMRVLDLGCGPGDVSFLAAEMVGPSGSVLGIDQAPEAVAAAKDGARHNGIKNVDFEVTTVEAFTSSVQFDAAVGRYVLLHQSDPTAFMILGARGVSLTVGAGVRARGMTAAARDAQGVN
jgi:SAM-dependent methyltransferase